MANPVLGHKGDLSRIPLHEQIADMVQQAIIARQLKPGDKLPPERKIAEELGVSRPTVGQAMRLLADRGMVDRRPGHGTRLLRLEYDALSEPISRFISLTDCTLEDLLEVRKLVEPKANALAAVRASSEDIKVLEQKVGEIEQAFQLGDAKEQARADAEFHAEAAKASKNPLLAAIAIGISHITREWLLETTRHAANKDNVRSHRLILEALINRDPDLAWKRSISHLDTTLELYQMSVKSRGAEQ